MTSIELSTAAFALSLISFFVAAGSLIVSIQQLKGNRAHQRLSVLPYLNLTHSLEVIAGKQMGSTMLRFPDTLTWTIKLDNTGVGPALIESFEIYIAGDKIKAEGEDLWREATKHISRRFSPAKCLFKYFNLTKGYCVANGASLEILSIKYEDLGDARQDMAEAVGSSRIIIKYKSFYGEGQTFDTDDHKTTASSLMPA